MRSVRSLGCSPIAQVDHQRRWREVEAAAEVVVVEVEVAGARR